MPSPWRFSRISSVTAGDTGRGASHVDVEPPGAALFKAPAPGADQVSNQEPLMLSSQLGRVILGGTTATEDEMRTGPDLDGGYGPLDDLLAETAARMDIEDRGVRRPGSRSPDD